MWNSIIFVFLISKGDAGTQATALHRKYDRNWKYYISLFNNNDENSIRWI